MGWEGCSDEGGHWRGEGLVVGDEQGRGGTTWVELCDMVYGNSRHFSVPSPATAHVTDRWNGRRYMLH